jgi:hypothetical protein
MPQFSFDKSELVALTRDLDRAAAIAPAAAAKVVTKAAVNIKADARQRISGLPHAPRYPYSITFDDVYVSKLGAQTRVGPDKDKRQGSLGNLLEYGSKNNPPHPHLGPAAEAEAPKFATAMQELAGKVLEP